MTSTIQNMGIDHHGSHIILPIYKLESMALSLQPYHPHQPCTQQDK